jgi:hypothetical protein
MIKGFNEYIAEVQKTYDGKETIQSIEEHNEMINDHSTFGYKVETNKRSIKFLITDEQNCCEDWGYFASEDNLEDFIGAKLIDVEVVNDALESIELKIEEIDKEHSDDERGTNTMFVNFNTSEGLL